MTAGPAGPARPADTNPASPLRRIVLTGFMGAGKSTVGRMLAARLGWPFLDIDNLISQERATSVAEIFAAFGEPFFRLLETDMVARTLSPRHEHQRAVIAVGGGAIESEAVRDLIFPAASVVSVPTTVTIFLAAPLAELLARCSGGADTPVRPLLAAHAEKPEHRLERRLPHYRRAHLTLDTSGASPAQVVEQLLDWLVSHFPGSQLR